MQWFFKSDSFFLLKNQTQPCQSTAAVQSPVIKKPGKKARQLYQKLGNSKEPGITGLFPINIQKPAPL
jgi:hypothetical protein